MEEQSDKKARQKENKKVRDEKGMISKSGRRKRLKRQDKKIKSKRRERNK